MHNNCKLSFSLQTETIMSQRDSIKSCIQTGSDYKALGCLSDTTAFGNFRISIYHVQRAGYKLHMEWDVLGAICFS